MQVLGHRGSRGAAAAGVGDPRPAENSIAAVLAALDGGADGVEIDVRRSLEGALVCRHDPDLAGRALMQTPVDDLRAAGLALLIDLLAATRGRGRVICEVKNVAGEPDFDAPDCATARLLLAALDPADDVVVSSFDWFTLEAIRAAGGPPTAFLTPPGVAVSAAVVYATGAGHAQLHAYTSDLLAAGASGVAKAQHAGLAVLAWTVTDLTTARQLADLGVDGLICDDPIGVRAGLAG